MAGTKAGGQKTRDRNLLKDPEYYSKIGKIGGSRSHTGGFASPIKDKRGMDGGDRASYFGRIGGLKSRKRKQDAENN